jgi:hypothetical protein
MAVETSCSNGVAALAGRPTMAAKATAAIPDKDLRK